MQDQLQSQAAPSGLQAFSLLAGRRRLTPIIIESVRAILAERGLLWTVKGDQAQRGNFGQLCLEADFDQALGLFLEQVPAAAGVLADAQTRQRFDINERTRRLNEQHVRAQLDEMTGKGVRR